MVVLHALDIFLDNKIRPLHLSLDFVLGIAGELLELSVDHGNDHVVFDDDGGCTRVFKYRPIPLLAFFQGLPGLQALIGEGLEVGQPPAQRL